MEFKDFLTESNKYFSAKVGDILSAIQDLNSNSEDMGLRHLVSNSETIVNQIRRIIHTHWQQSERGGLEVLQKCGVAIMRAIEEKDDLRAVLKACQENIESISGGEKVNDIATD